MPGHGELETARDCTRRGGRKLRGDLSHAPSMFASGQPCLSARVFCRIRPCRLRRGSLGDNPSTWLSVIILLVPRTIRPPDVQDGEASPGMTAGDNAALRLLPAFNCSGPLAGVEPVCWELPITVPTFIDPQFISLPILLPVSQRRRWGRQISLLHFLAMSNSNQGLTDLPSHQSTPQTSPASRSGRRGAGMLV